MKNNNSATRFFNYAAIDIPDASSAAVLILKPEESFAKELSKFLLLTEELV